jgi:hypothetical protein
MLAKNLRAPRGVRCTASSLTTIATVRRFDKLAPTGVAQIKKRKRLIPAVSAL